MWHGSQQQADTSLHQCLLKIEACISRWSSLFPSDCSPQNKVPSDSFNVNKAIHISLAAQPRHRQRLGFTNIKDSCRVTAPHFQLSWTVGVALDCLFITNYTFTMATQSHLDWNIQAFAGASKFNDTLVVSSAQFLILRAVVSSARISHTCKIKHQLSWLGVMLSDRTEDCVNVTFSLKIFSMIWIPLYSLVKSSMEIKVK